MLFADLLSLHLVTFLMFFILVAHGKQSRSLASYNKQLLVGNTECHSLDEEEGHFGTMYPLNVRNLLKAALE